MRYGSLFTGGGGLDLAVEDLWPEAELAWWSEVDEPAAASFARHTDAPNLGDVTAIDWTDVEPVDLIVGGFPCQDLSHAGKRVGIGGDRSGLWFRMLDAMTTLRPAFALLENVAGIYSAAGDYDAVALDRNPLDGRSARPPRALDVVLGSLADSRWDAEWGDLRASAVGAPHQRRRWFCVAWPATADPDHSRLEGRTPGIVRERARQWPPRQGRTPAGVTLPTPRASDANGPWIDRAAGGHNLGTAIRLLATPQARDAKGIPGAGYNERSLPRDVTEWREYVDSIRRWERILGRPAPHPVDEKGRLSADFDEWLMGWPAEWTVGSRRERIRMCGNGVVPQQATHAYRQLFARIEAPR